MRDRRIGSIGGGRVVKIILSGFNRAGRMPPQIIVSEKNAGVLKKLKQDYPEIRVSPNGNAEAASQDLILLALHPPVAVGCSRKSKGS